MLALEAHRIAHCSGCGQPLNESTEVDNDGAYTTRNIRCHGCAAIAHASHKFKDDDAYSSLRFVVTKRKPRG